MSTIRVTDADLVERARNGDHGAFGELVDRHRVAVYRAAMAALGSHAEAEDAAQDAFVMAWRRIDSFRGEASFRTWLLTIAWHQAINRRRGLAWWWKRTVPLDGEPDGPKGVRATYEGQAALSYGGRALSGSSDSAAHRTPEQIVGSDRLRRDIRTAIQALSPKLRGALLLAQSGDYRYEEIGAMMHAPVGTIKWRVAEARRLVKIRLQTLGHDQLG